jgi:hypothetical protein
VVVRVPSNRTTGPSSPEKIKGTVLGMCPSAIREAHTFSARPWLRCIGDEFVLDHVFAGGVLWRIHEQPESRAIGNVSIAGEILARCGGSRSANAAHERPSLKWALDEHIFEHEITRLVDLRIDRVGFQQS